PAALLVARNQRISRCFGGIHQCRFIVPKVAAFVSFQDLDFGMGNGMGLEAFPARFRLLLRASRKRPFLRRLPWPDPKGIISGKEKRLTGLEEMAPIDSTGHESSPRLLGLLAGRDAEESLESASCPRGWVAVGNRRGRGGATIVLQVAERLESKPM